VVELMMKIMMMVVVAMVDQVLRLEKEEREK
jgi:hypothetical protein